MQSARCEDGKMTPCNPTIPPVPEVQTRLAWTKPKRSGSRGISPRTAGGLGKEGLIANQNRMLAALNGFSTHAKEQ
jgi:hypothetical protein